MARPRSFDTETALAAVERQFRKTGYAGTSVDDIAAATGLGRGSLFNAFGDKHHLFMRALDCYCRRNEADVTALLAGPDQGAIDRLRAFLADAAEVGPDGRGSTCMATKFVVELEGRDPEAQARVSASFGVMERRLVACVEAAQRHGDLDPDADADVLGRLVFTVSRGLDVMSRSGPSAAELGVLAEAAFALLPRAVAPSPLA